MDKITIDQALIACHDVTTESAFTNRVMSSITHRASVKKPIFIKIKHMSRFALATLTFCSIVATSGSAYAAYQMWFNPTAKVQNTGQNQYGRDEFLATLSNCGTTASALYEVKTGISLSEEEIAQLLQARCELDFVQKWANKNWRPSTPTLGVNVSFEAFRVTAVDKSTISLHSSQFDTVLDITKDTQFIANNMKTSANSIKTENIVVYVERDTYLPSSGSPTKRELMAIIKLELPIEAYSVNRQSQVNERTSCIGNSNESCINSASIDVYPRNNEDVSSKTVSGDFYRIQGELISNDGASFELKSSSGAIYKVTAPLDIISRFNSDNSTDYGTSIIIGDMISVQYFQNVTDDHKTIQPQQIHSINLLIELTNKTDDFKKY